MKGLEYNVDIKADDNSVSNHAHIFISSSSKSGSDDEEQSAGYLSYSYNYLLY